LLLESNEALRFKDSEPGIFAEFVRPYIGSEELINGKLRYCLWISDSDQKRAMCSEFIASRLEKVAEMRANSSKTQTKMAADWPHRFGEIRHRSSVFTIIVLRVSSENREFLPVGLVQGGTIIGDRNFALYDAPLWNMALIASRLHWVWIGTVCMRLEMRFSYSNTLGWNTFPVPTLSEQNKADLTRCAEDILLVREAHFPAEIADLYDPKNMPTNLREAHDLPVATLRDRNDEVLERIYISRRFKNDTERLEKLFELYTKMAAQQPLSKKPANRKRGK
jgi:hypothetical protein